MKLNLSTGIIPSPNVYGGLLGFFFVNGGTFQLDVNGGNLGCASVSLLEISIVQMVISPIELTSWVAFHVVLPPRSSSSSSLITSAKTFPPPSNTRAGYGVL
ncbi:hypothetical protein L1887_28796 [Cichorium endivia]|nr:hypothetical protein L1887_28796 [Cichorium endivia]